MRRKRRRREKKPIPSNSAYGFFFLDSFDEFIGFTTMYFFFYAYAQKFCRKECSDLFPTIFRQKIASCLGTSKIFSILFLTSEKMTQEREISSKSIIAFFFSFNSKTNCYRNLTFSPNWYNFVNETNFAKNFF